MGLSDKKDFFADFIEGFGQFQGHLGEQQDDFKRVDDIGALAGLWTDCDDPVSNTALKDFDGTWCTAFPVMDMDDAWSTHAFVECMKVCNESAGDANPKFLVRNGLAQWSGKDSDIDMESFTAPADGVTCLDPWIAYHGTLKSNGTTTANDAFTGQSVNLVKLLFDFEDGFGAEFEEAGRVDGTTLERGFLDAGLGGEDTFCVDFPKDPSCDVPEFSPANVAEEEYFAFYKYTKTTTPDAACTSEDYKPIDELFGFTF